MTTKSEPLRLVLDHIECRINVTENEIEYLFEYGDSEGHYRYSIITEEGTFKVEDYCIGNSQCESMDDAIEEVSTLLDREHDIPKSSKDEVRAFIVDFQEHAEKQQKELKEENSRSV